MAPPVFPCLISSPKFQGIGNTFSLMLRVELLGIGQASLLVKRLKALSEKTKHDVHILPLGFCHFPDLLGIKTFLSAGFLALAWGEALRVEEARMAPAFFKGMPSLRAISAWMFLNPFLLATTCPPSYRTSS